MSEDRPPEGSGHFVDARGERCPLPVIRLARLAGALEPGALVTLLATDPAARHDVPAWCRMRGHRLLSVSEAPDDRGSDEGGSDEGRDDGGRDDEGRDDEGRDDDGRVTTMVIEVRGRVG